MKVKPETGRNFALSSDNQAILRAIQSDLNSLMNINPNQNRRKS
tara:strand:+ start:373 stop:504 length:132 start_codon:yes stop_codon:yes gene_type:complete